MSKKKTPDRRPPQPPSMETRKVYREMLEKRCGANTIDAVAITKSIEAQVVLLGFSASAGDQVAHQALVKLAARLCNEVSEASCNEQPAADEIARKRMSWPVLVHHDKTTRKWNLRWLNVLPLGEDTGWRPGNRGSRSADITSIPNTTVLLEIQSMTMDLRAIDLHGYCRWDQRTKDLCELPSFAATKDVLDKWFRVLWNRILERGSPEKDKRLRPLGEPAANSKKDAYRKGSKSYESNVRQGIRATLQTAFRSITNYPKNSG